jgi:flagellar secretion chaperone FliS
MYGSRASANFYRDTNIDSGKDIAPQRKVSMLLGGTLERVRMARVHVVNEDRGAKAQAISSAIAILEALRLSLDPEVGGELAERLGALYDYATLRLTEANAFNDVARLDEVISLIEPIAIAWAEGPERHVGDPGATG